MVYIIEMNFFKMIKTPAFIRYATVFNASLTKGVLSAVRPIRAGEEVTVPFPESKKRDADEKEEIDRLAAMSYDHATRN